MKFSAAACITLAAMLAEVSLARNCKDGMDYCGRNLDVLGR